jgi:multidrug resistance efflux pump
MSILKRLDSRLPRLLLATIIVVALGSVLAERVLYRTSIEAVVNAPRVELVAPFAGVIDSVGAAPGDVVAGGALVARLRRDAWSPEGEAPSASRAALQFARADIIATELHTLLELQEELGMRETQYRKTMIARLVDEQRAAVARAEERRVALEQLEALQKVNGTTLLDLAHARTDRAAADADLSRIGSALASARHGIVTGEGGQDVPYSRQRIDQLAVDIARLRAERDALKAEARSFMASGGPGDSAAVGQVPIRAPSSGVIWRLNATPGTRVLQGATLATLVDCSRVYLEATVTPRDGDRIALGKTVVVRFAGTSEESHGVVRAVRGGGLRQDGSAAAELTLTNRQGDTHVMVDINAQAIGQTRGNFCQVGRNAKVYFDETAAWLPLQYLSGLTR